MKFPKMTRVEQVFDAPTVDDIPGEIARQVNQLNLEGSIRPGASVAVACSSRGIANYSSIIKATVQCLKDLGLVPFLFPAMGSHGAATAEGQKQVLENYGVTEGEMGVPIRSCLDVVQIADTEDGVPVYVDQHAAKADHIVLVNRVKPHTEFEFEIQSGLIKMMAIGLGKEKGAALYHRAVMNYGYPRVILSVARKVLETGKILFGVGIVENGYAQTAEIGVVAASEMQNKERALLKTSKDLALRLPFDEVDVLIIDEMGKDISGSGFDTKVVGRILMPLVTDEPTSPRVKRIVVCDLTRNTAGNADGVGIADFVTRRLVDRIDIKALYVNALAGSEPEHAKIPMTMENDGEAIRAAIDSLGLIALDALKVIRIKNTLKLKEVDVSEAYRDQVSARSDLEIKIESRSLQFDPQGNLVPF